MVKIMRQIKKEMKNKKIVKKRKIQMKQKQKKVI